jgi:hypothetical protein
MDESLYEEPDNPYDVHPEQFTPIDPDLAPLWGQIPPEAPVGPRFGFRKEEPTIASVLGQHSQPLMPTDYSGRVTSYEGTSRPSLGGGM